VYQYKSEGAFFCVRGIDIKVSGHVLVC
jgi:hypothetical protein